MIYFQICIFEPLETTPAEPNGEDVSCDLLSNLYLWTIGNNLTECNSINGRLWFTFKFVSLNHWKQPACPVIRSFLCCDLLSNLYLWTIGNNQNKRICRAAPLWFTFKFVSLNHWKQLPALEAVPALRCDLLSNLYLWTIGNNAHICLISLALLWFTFKFVSLNHWKQQHQETRFFSSRCDLLSNLYLWTIGNNWQTNKTQ